MVANDIKVALAIVKNAQEKVDSLSYQVTQGGKELPVCQAVLSASWSLRSAMFALQLASGMVESSTSQNTTTSRTPGMGGG